MKKGKWQCISLALAVILITLIKQNTIAYYTTVSRSTNVVTSGDIQLVLHEKTADGSDFPKEGVAVIPGDIVSKIVTIENKCKHPFYLRVKLVKGIDSEILSGEDCLRVNITPEKWVLKEDGYIYYTDILQPGEHTIPVFTEVEIVGEQMDQHYAGHELTLTISAYAVQSENNPAEYPWEAAGWPAE